MMIVRFVYVLLFSFSILFSNVVFSDQKINWDKLSFDPIPTSYMFKAFCEVNGSWQQGELVSYGDLAISPSSCALNYGQSILEGMKAYRTKEGKIVLFRPEENARRFQKGAVRLGMPILPEEMFIKAVKQTVLANIDWVPPYGKGTLYIRPLLIGTGSLLSLTPAPSYTFLIFVTPVGDYFKGGVRAIDLVISDEFHRAHPGGVGDIKTIVNYAANFVPLQKAKQNGFAEILYLDVTNQYVEEVGAANFFCVKDGILYTPELTGTILPGITRDSIILLASHLGYEVKEQKIDLDLVFSSDEAFCSGTAAVIAPIGSITHNDRKIVYEEGNIGPVTLEFYHSLTGIQNGEIEDPFNWLHEVN
ncbi:MAG: putative branched-chain-amino-acid aminotransferase [Chlamydiae bacterium]|nr:putative branched-chain-amino-acid aminotransferase [Chlamydiota bacterium]